MKITASDAPTPEPPRTDKKIIRYKQRKWGQLNDKDMVQHEWTLWDGESYWGGNPPFCTNACAVELACAALRAGFRT